DDNDDSDDDSYEVTKDDENDVESDADDDKEASNREKMDSNEDENANLNQNDDEAEEHDEEYEKLYKDVNVRLTNTKHEEQRKEDEEMMDAGRDDSTQQTRYKQVKDNEHLTVTTIYDTQKTVGPMQSSSVSSDFARQFLNLDNAPLIDSEVVSLMNVKVCHEEPSTQIPSLLNIHVMVILKTSSTARSTIPLKIPLITHLQQQSTPTPTPTPTTTTTMTSVPA
nr:hypothetical protein [Tanacetum cinerariifolium]